MKSHEKLETLNNQVLTYENKKRKKLNTLALKKIVEDIPPQHSG